MEFELSLMEHLCPHVWNKKWVSFLSSFLIMGWSRFRSGISSSLSFLYLLPSLVDLNLGISKLPTYSLNTMFLITAISESGGCMSSDFHDLLISLIVLSIHAVVLLVLTMFTIEVDIFLLMMSHMGWDLFEVSLRKDFILMLRITSL